MHDHEHHRYVCMSRLSTSNEYIYFPRHVKVIVILTNENYVRYSMLHGAAQILSTILVIAMTTICSESPSLPLKANRPCLGGVSLRLVGWS